MSAIQILGINAVVILVYVVALWGASVATKDAGIVDSFWGLGFLVSSVVYFIFAQGYSGRKILVLILVAVWGLRLSFSEFSRRSGSGEGPRYEAMRARRVRSFWWFSLFRVFLPSGVLMWIISAPLLAAQYTPEPTRLVAWDIVGIVLWLIGFGIEAIGDARSARFRLDPDDRAGTPDHISNRSLWHYVRHPAYIGQAIVWWAFYLIAVAAHGWWAFYGPVVATILLLALSGMVKLRGRQSARGEPPASVSD